MQQTLANRPATRSGLEYVWGVYKQAVRSRVEPHLSRGWIVAAEFTRFRDSWRPDNSHIIALDCAPIGWGGARITSDAVHLEHLYIESGTNLICSDCSL